MTTPSLFFFLSITVLSLDLLCCISKAFWIFKSHPPRPQLPVHTLFPDFAVLYLSLLSMCFSGLLCDLLWSDPDKDVQGWGENDRGVSFTFGADVVSKFLNRHDLDLICRAHQVIKKGMKVESLKIKCKYRRYGVILFL